MKKCVNIECGDNDKQRTLGCGKIYQRPVECEDYLTATKAASSSLSSDGLSCPVMEDCEFVSWLAGDKNILVAALREIYFLRGEDKEIEQIVNDALEAGSAT